MHPNLITKSTDEMTVIERRIMYLAINQMDTGLNMAPDLFTNLIFQIPLANLGETNYSRLKNSVKNLKTRSLKVIDNDEQQEYKYIVPFPSAEIKSGVLTLKMFSDVVPFFLELKNGYTKYELQAALSLSSVYSQKLYEHLNRWKDKKKWFISLTELQTALNAENYRYAQFKQRCLDPAIKEINDQTDLIVTYAVEKRGRAVSAIIFSIRLRVAHELEESKQMVAEDLNELREMRPIMASMYGKEFMSKYTFSKNQKESILYTPSLFQEFIELDRKIEHGVLKVKKDRTAYVASVLFEKNVAKK
jgi:plasmid replication initiation protein